MKQHHEWPCAGYGRPLFLTERCFLLGALYPVLFLASSSSFSAFIYQFHEGKYTDTKVYFIPGNHGIGYASINSHKPEVVIQYIEEFGIRNFRFTAGKVEFIAIDAQTLDDKENHTKL
ncbi:uncharacterized protein LOC110613901 isoform X2 [Manihot esculenta]|uniref:uncharacterized protein LOC110613901 isoform X2 n=1 Tax=Manihot esculenta TaxID=3983 RepID=UPI000B5D7A4B|nr:uncharacterized protein LOC110613901 isoform X2 [Manihot esculenta]